MSYDLPDHVYKGILELAERHQIQDVILFGSRATGKNAPRSDVDLAVRGGNCRAFAWEADDPMYLPTLLFIDVVNLDKPLDPVLRREIERDGIALRGRL